MIQRCLSALFALLLIGSVVWGQCVACSSSPIQPAASAHDCCKKTEKTDHCGKPMGTEKSCADHDRVPAFEKSEVKQQVELTAAETAVGAIFVAATSRSDTATVAQDQPPPDLFVLNSTFRI